MMLSLSALSEDIFGFRSITSLCEWIFLKFIKKVQYHKWKVGIDFDDGGQNRSEIRGPKGTQNKHFSTFRIITCV